MVCYTTWRTTEAREHAIHEAWKHAERANELSKESAEARCLSFRFEVFRLKI